MRLLSSATMGWRGLISIVFWDIIMFSFDESCMACSPTTSSVTREAAGQEDGWRPQSCQVYLSI